MSKNKVDKKRFIESAEGKATIWIVTLGCVGIILYALFTFTPIGTQAVQLVFGEPPPAPVRHYSLQKAYETCRLRVLNDAGAEQVQQITLDARSTRYVESRVEYLVFLNVKIAGRDDYWSSCEISAATLNIERFRLRADNTGSVGNIFGF